MYANDDFINRIGNPGNWMTLNLSQKAKNWHWATRLLACAYCVG